MSDVELNYNKILKILVNNAPVGAVKISFDYEVKAEDDDLEGGVSYYSFWMYDQIGEKSTYFIEKPIVGYQLGEECLQLRKAMFINTGNKWRKMSLEINFAEDKFYINHEY